MTMDSNKDKSFLGRGWSFPPTFDKKSTPGVEMVSAEEDIKQSLEILLGTSIGERVMMSDYGCNIHEHLFDSINTSQVHYLKELIRTAIIKFEPRIKLIEVFIDQSDFLDGILRIQVEYSILSSNTRFNLVFPYYKVEGTDIPQLYNSQITYTKSAELDN